MLSFKYGLIKNKYASPKKENKFVNPYKNVSFMPSPSIGNKRSKTKLSAEPKNSIKTLKSTNGMKTRFTLDMDFKPYFAIIIIGNMNNIIKTITGVLGKYINKSALAK